MKHTFKSGIVRNPSSSEGALEYAMNMIAENGELKILPSPETLQLQLAQGERLLCVHRPEGNVHYVVKNGMNLAYYDSEHQRHEISSFNSEIQSAVVMGNVLVLRTEEGGGYAIWKEGKYQCVDSRLPQLQMQFRMKNHYVQTFAKGDDTGITVATASTVKDYDFSEIVPPTPMTVSGSGELQFAIDVNLQQNAVYRLQCRMQEGAGQNAMTLWLVDDNGGERFVGYDAGKSPYVTFSTNATDRVVRLRCVLNLSERYRFLFSAVLMKGGAAADNLVIEHSQENFNAVMAVANRFLADNGRKANRFVYPFFVRYALRMYDGSLVCPSAPCLMVPNSGVAPHLWMIAPQGRGTVDTYCSAVVGQLACRLADSSELQRWKGLVSGLVIGVSAPLYSFNEGAEWSAKRHDLELRQAASDDSSWGYGLFDYGNGGYSADWLFKHYNSVDNAAKVLEVVLPHFDDDHRLKDLSEKGEFYIVSEIPVDDLPSDGGWHDVDMEDEALMGLEGRQRMDDNAMSLSPRWGNAMMVYNSRLVIGDVTEDRFPGFMPAMLNGCCGTGRNGQTAGVPVNWMKAVVTCAENGDTFTLCAKDTEEMSQSPLFWFAYPSASATKAVVWRQLLTGAYQRAELQLKPHKLLDMAYWFGGFGEPMWSEYIREEDLTEEQLAELQTAEGGVRMKRGNKIHQSEVNNPFLFLPEQTNLVGDARVIAMASATQALSQGQFGEFPLYVFASDGIWAMKVGDDGTFRAIHPLSRDVCTGPQAVAMTDNAVVFATQQGLKILNGSTTKLLSGQMEGMPPDLTALKGLIPAFDRLMVEEGSDFNHMICRCLLAYDYPSNLIHVFPDDMAAHYVCSLNSGAFTLADDIAMPVAVVNDYPDTILQTGQTLLIFSNMHESTGKMAMAVTTPMALGNPMGRKRLRDLRVVWKQIDSMSTVKTAVLVSNDRLKWWRMKSLYSHSYRWFRFAIFANVNDYESIQSVILI